MLKLPKKTNSNKLEMRLNAEDLLMLHAVEAEPRSKFSLSNFHCLFNLFTGQENVDPMRPDLLTQIGTNKLDMARQMKKRNTMKVLDF